MTEKSKATAAANSNSAAAAVAAAPSTANAPYVSFPSSSPSVTSKVRLRSFMAVFATVLGYLEYAFLPSMQLYVVNGIH